MIVVLPLGVVMITFRARYPRAAAERTGFDLGHLEVVGADGTAASDETKPPIAMMLVVSLCDLLDGIGRIASGEQTKYELVGVGSSFALIFKDTGHGRVQVVYKDRALGEASGPELLQAALACVRKLMASEGDRFSDTDVAYRDLVSAMRKAESVFS